MAILAIMKKKTRGLISISREIHIYVEESFVLEIYIISLHAPTILFQSVYTTCIVIGVTVKLMRVKL